MNISADFGITVTDTIRKEGDNIIHEMNLSSNEISHTRVRDLFPNIDFNSNKVTSSYCYIIACRSLKQKQNSFLH